MPHRQIDNCLPPCPFKHLLRLKLISCGNYLRGSFQIPALSARGLARANRNNMIAELAYGIYTAQISIPK